MDTAVALVDTYLRINGYFTVTEYPVIEAVHYDGYRTVTDLDILAFRFSGAGRLIPAERGSSPRLRVVAPDPKLGSIAEHADMLIGEVKEGRAELNRAARDPVVLETVLTRFGCCRAEHVPAVVKDLLHKGHAQTHSGHRVRLVAFGSTVGEDNKCTVISLGHVVNFLRDYIHQYWDILHNSDSKDPAFGFLMMLEKARLGLKMV
jgi:hypothetical protein